MELIHSFGHDGLYGGSAERPFDPVRGEGATINDAVATLDPLPPFDPEGERVRRVEGVWVVEAIPLPDQTSEPEPEPAPPQYPRFFGNQKLDLFTPAEQLAVVAATMHDPVVKLFYDRLLGATYLSYEDPETERGLTVLMEKGLLTQERKGEVVAAMQ